MTWLLFVSALALAFANGANDNTKSVATLVGSRQLAYPRALQLATLAQLAGSLASVALASGLIVAFSGRGLVPPEALSTSLLAAVALAAALTVAAATHVGLPISTTHAIVGALLGAAFGAGSAASPGALAAIFVVPLAVGPLAAVGLSWLLARGGDDAARRLGVAAGDCVCIAPPSDILGGNGALARNLTLQIEVADPQTCRAHGDTRLLGIDIAAGIRAGHLLSASAVGFARGLNDTPKILGLVIGASVVAPWATALLLGLAMASGGWLAARRVTHTLADEITPLEDAGGFAANLSTSLLVIGASRFGLPVSTTHVSAGAITGAGAAGGSLRHVAVRRIASAWVATLPVAAGLGALLAWSFR